MTIQTTDSLAKRFVIAWAGAFVVTLLAWRLLSLGHGQTLTAWVLTACLVAIAAVPFAAIAAVTITRNRWLLVVLAAVLTTVAVVLWFFGIPRSGTPIT